MEEHTVPPRQYDKQGNELGWGWFGYEGAVCDGAIRADSVANLKEVIRRGYIDGNSKTLSNQTMVQYAEYCGAKACRQHMVDLGWK